ncbi:MAG: hypothetical protein MJZ11_09910 [Lachnospiraceae bacterium]|nr:hypothetical protein [Lachnospiraceae bacterium]
MRYKIVTDNNLNIPEELKSDLRIEKITADKNCQYPSDYEKAFDSEAEMIIVLASSDSIGNSYSTAVAGRRMYLDGLKRQGMAKKKIFVLDYESALAKTEDIVTLAFKSCEKGLSFGDTCLDLMFSYNKIKVVNNLATFAAICPAGA